MFPFRQIKFAGAAVTLISVLQCSQTAAAQGGRHGPSDHRFTQELEVGLPHRFGLAAEASFEGTLQGPDPQP